MPRLTRSWSTSIPSTTASTSSPFLRSSEGWRTFLVHERSEMCTRPSIPGSISTNTPKSVIDLTLPLIVLPTGWRSASASHGFGSICLSPSEILRLASSTPSTWTSTVSPTFTSFDECAVVGDAHHLAGEARSDRITLGGTRPRVGHDLLHPERDAFARRVVFEHDHLDLVTDLDRFGGMLEAAPRHVGDMQQAVDSAKVDEGAVVSDVLDGAFEDHALFEHLES